MVRVLETCIEGKMWTINTHWPWHCRCPFFWRQCWVV